MEADGNRKIRGLTGRRQLGVTAWHDHQETPAAALNLSMQTPAAATGRHFQCHSHVTGPPVRGCADRERAMARTDACTCELVDAVEDERGHDEHGWVLAGDD
jgi:hypothetical protein